MSLNSFNSLYSRPHIIYGFSVTQPIMHKFLKQMRLLNSFGISPLALSGTASRNNTTSVALQAQPEDATDDATPSAKGLPVADGADLSGEISGSRELDTGTMVIVSKREPVKIAETDDPKSLALKSSIDASVDRRIADITVETGEPSLSSVRMQHVVVREKDFSKIPEQDGSRLREIGLSIPKVWTKIRSFLNKQRYIYESQSLPMSQFRQRFGQLNLRYTISQSWFSVYTTTAMYAGAADRCLEPFANRFALGSSNIVALLGALIGYTQCAMYNRLFRFFNQKDKINIAKLRQPIILRVPRYFRTFWHNLSGQSKIDDIMTMTELGGEIASRVSIKVDYESLGILQMYDILTVSLNIARILEASHGLDISTSQAAITILLNNIPMSNDIVRSISTNEVFRNIATQYREKINLQDIVAGDFDSLLNQINEFEQLFRDYIDFTQMQDVVELSVVDLLSPFNGMTNWIELTGFPLVASSTTLAFYPKVDMINHLQIYVSTLFRISLDCSDEVIHDYLGMTYSGVRLDPFSRIINSPVFQRTATIIMLGFEFNIPLNTRPDEVGQVNYILVGGYGKRQFNFIHGTVGRVYQFARFNRKDRSRGNRFFFDPEF